jgi:hypothetical protein
MLQYSLAEPRPSPTVDWLAVVGVAAHPSVAVHAALSRSWASLLKHWVSAVDFDPSWVEICLVRFPDGVLLVPRPRGATLAGLVAVAGARWAIEDCFAEAKNETGLDHYQARVWKAWYRHITLSMLAHPFLAVTARASRPAAAPPDPPGTSPGTGAAIPDEPGKKGLLTCGQPFASQDIQPAPVHNR